MTLKFQSLPDVNCVSDIVPGNVRWESMFMILSRLFVKFVLFDIVL